MKYHIIKSNIFLECLEQQPLKEQFQVQKRIALIEAEGHFGEHKDLGEGLFELKWINGRRIYYAIEDHVNVLILYEGNKNGQNHDIHHARNILGKYHETRRATIDSLQKTFSHCQTG